MGEGLSRVNLQKIAEAVTRSSNDLANSANLSTGEDFEAKFRASLMLEGVHQGLEIAMGKKRTIKWGEGLVDLRVGNILKQ